MDDCKVLTIIIPAYNVEQYIERCVVSCESIDIDKDEFEIIIINDGSKDSTLEKLSVLADRFNNIKVFTQENQGQSVARNLGVEKARGRYLWFVDSDDFVLSKGIKQAINKSIELDLEITMFLMKVFRQDGSSYIIEHPYLKPGVLSTGEQVLLSGYVGGSVCSTLYSRSFIQDNNLRFVEGIIHQDSEFSLRATALSKRIYNISIPIYVYFYNDSSSTRSVSFEKVNKAVVSDIVVAERISLFTQNNNLSTRLNKYLKCTSTSLLVSVVLSLMRSKREDKRILYEAVMKEMISRNLYPIKGRTKSWKTTALIPFVNRRWLIEFLMR